MMVNTLRRTVKPLARKLLAYAWGQTPTNSQRSFEWSIGIYTGESPVALTEPPDLVNPVLTREDVTDVPAGFVADPFMLRVRDQWYMFFEVKNQQSKRGEIALATSTDGKRWQYERVVLTEPFHLSYPYVFEWMNTYYMIPESHQANSIRLYKAVDFPFQWSLVNIVRDGNDYVDSSIFFYREKWWLLTGLGEAPNYADTLCLLYAEDIRGPWREHPCNPIITSNAHIARPSGRVIVHEDTIIRYAQDCDPFYGKQVYAFAITDLTTTSYHEQPASTGPIVTGSGQGWNKTGMHHVDAQYQEQRWVACVDGWSQTEIDDTAT